MMFRLILLIVLGFATPLMAAGSGAVLTVSGTGQIGAVPDMATVTLGVEVEAPDARGALQLNSARMTEIFAALAAADIAAKDIQTSQLSLYPQRDSTGTNQSGALKITGFVATNQITVTVRALTHLGAVLDTLTNSGANRIQGISFDLADEQPVLDAARRAAVADAMRKAYLYATAAGLPLGAILSINEGGSAPMPTQFLSRVAMEAPMPVAEGELTLSATVTIRFALGE